MQEIQGLISGICRLLSENPGEEDLDTIGNPELEEPMVCFLFLISGPFRIDF